METRQIKNDDLSSWIRLLYGEPVVVFSSLLRGMILPSEGCELFVADFSKIEVAVLWWLADNEPGLKILRSGKDVYKSQAALNTGKRYEDIHDEGDDRQLAKAQILGCGFGMGVDKFLATAWDFYRLKLSKDQAKAAVYGYRESHKSVPQMWRNAEQAAISAVEDGVAIRVNHCRFFVKDKFLWIQLPSGRRLAYREPHLVWRKTDFGTQKTLQFWSVNSKTKKWGVERTWGGTLTENIVQAVARDLMMPAMVRLEKAGYRGLLSVHDEGLCERKKGEGCLKEFTQIMCETPTWGKGLPIEAKGWVGPRYKK